MKIPEILAPAGSMDALTAALRSGADAVYVGGKRFSARNSQAAGLTDEELKEAALLCHKYGAKLYIAVNTIITDDEAADFCDFVKFTASIGIDAFIVQDWGCFDLIKTAVPDAVIHASTQMSVHTAIGTQMLGELGFSRVVPARELDRHTIKKICSGTTETEIFVHGALCMSVSGQCYMSAMMGGRSANRGCCGQACRLPFSSAGNKNSCVLSLKDLSLLKNAAELAESGVDSLKIEGRMKRPEYVAAAVYELKKAIGGDQPDMKLLRDIFSRDGFTDGYFTGNRTDMFGKREKDDVISARTVIPALHELYRSERHVHKVDFHVEIHENKPVTITADCLGITASVSGDVPEKALTRPTDHEAVKKQLSKLGDTVFFAGKISSNIGPKLMVRAGKLNELRRNLTEKLTQLVTEKFTPAYTITHNLPELPETSTQSMINPLPLRTLCRTEEQVKAATDFSEYIIVPMELINDSITSMVAPDRLIISPPRFISSEEKLISDLMELKTAGFDRIFCHTPDSIAIGKKIGFRLHGSSTLNVCNSYAAENLRNLGLEDCVFSFETKLSRLDNIRTSLPLGTAVYGHLPLMLTRNCPIKNEIGCKNCTRKLTDRMGKSFPVICSKDYTEILNPDVLCMTDKQLPEGVSFGIVMLANENEEQTRSILSGGRPDGKLTHGLYYRGI
ncbi:MAG: U32 family peptidase [Ruminococcus sp.]|nr:U32 family peptidase [Ruminococcus sp.]